MVATLLQHNAPLNARDLAGNTALHLAASRGFKEVVRLLLEHPQTELNASNKEGLTPLHVAVESGFIKVVEVIIYLCHFSYSYFNLLMCLNLCYDVSLNHVK